MDKNTVSVLKIDISTLPKREVLEEMQKFLLQNKKLKIKNQKDLINPFVIFTPNPEIIVYATKDDVFRKIVNSAQINIPDGWGVVWAAQKLFGKKLERIAGVDLVEDLVKMASLEGLEIGLIGGKAGIAIRTLECLWSQNTKLHGWAEEGGEVVVRNKKIEVGDQLMGQIVKKIIEHGTRMVFVGLGFPKQEYFIDTLAKELQNAHYYKPVMLMAVGGAFDNISGRIPRAPGWVRDHKLEWLFRLVREPQRLGRQLKGAEFFWRILVKGLE